MKKLLLSEEASKVCEYNFFHEMQAKSSVIVIYLFNYDSSKSSFFMLNMAFDVVLSTIF